MSKEHSWFTVVDDFDAPNSYGSVDVKIHIEPDVESNHPDFGKRDGFETVSVFLDSDIVAGWYDETLSKDDYAIAIERALLEEGYKLESEYAPTW